MRREFISEKDFEQCKQRLSDKFNTYYDYSVEYDAGNLQIKVRFFNLRTMKPENRRFMTVKGFERFVRNYDRADKQRKLEMEAIRSKYR